MKKRYWLTPPDIYEKLDAEFHFDFDPCPCPLPDNFNALEIDWGKMNYVNPPFCKVDGMPGGPTAFVRKAIEELQKGRESVFIVPVRSYVHLLLEAGAEARPMGRIRWLEVETGDPMTSPNLCCCFVLRYNKPMNLTPVTTRFAQKGLFTKK
jgi:hypothetical protein